MSAICPCCKRKMPAPKAAKGDKRLTQDLAKAQSAIEVCERVLLNPPTDLSRIAPYTSVRVDNGELQCGEANYPTYDGFVEGVQLERERMIRALTDHRLLWNIYRRRDKGLPYYTSTAVERTDNGLPSAEDLDVVMAESNAA